MPEEAGEEGAAGILVAASEEGAVPGSILVAASGRSLKLPTAQKILVQDIIPTGFRISFEQLGAHPS